MKLIDEMDELEKIKTAIDNFLGEFECFHKPGDNVCEACNYYCTMKNDGNRECLKEKLKQTASDIMVCLAYKEIRRIKNNLDDMCRWSKLD